MQTYMKFTWANFHHANLLDGMGRNPSPKLVKVADGFLRSRAPTVNYKYIVVEIEYTSNCANLEFGSESCKWCLEI